MTLVKYHASPLQWIKDEFGEHFSSQKQLNSKGGLFGWEPHMDIEELPNYYLLKVDIPGVSPKNIQVDITNNLLTLQGERLQETKDKGHYERYSGKFYRRMQLPKTVNGEKATANGKHGVLEIKIPKEEGSSTRYIEVKEV